MASTRQAAARYGQAMYEMDAQTGTTLNDLRKQYNLCISSRAKVAAYELAVQSATTQVTATRQSVLAGQRSTLTCSTPNSSSIALSAIWPPPVRLHQVLDYLAERLRDVGRERCYAGSAVFFCCALNNNSTNSSATLSINLKEQLKAALFCVYTLVLTLKDGVR